MRAFLITCDRCKATLENHANANGPFSNIGTVAMTGHGIARTYDLCAVCFKILLTTILNPEAQS